MLILPLYSFENNILKLDFLDKNQLKCNRLLIVTPDPSKADGIRSQLPHGQSIEVDTISNFLKKLLIDHFGREIDSKFDLNLKIGTKWGQTELKFEDFNFFSQILTLFTEIRSFSTQEDIFDEVLETLPRDIALGLKTMMLIFKDLDLTDEHGAYGKLSSSSLNLVKHDMVLFWGFKFLSGPQIDFIKALARKINVLIPFPEIAFNEKNDSDWISWVLSGLLPDKDLKIINVDEKEDPALSGIELMVFLPSDLNSSLKKQLREAKDLKVIWGSFGRGSYVEVFSTPMGNRTNKLPIDFYSSKIFEVFNEIAEVIYTKGIIAKEFKEKLHSHLKKMVIIEKHSFIKIKVTLMLSRIFSEVFRGDENEVVSLFSLNLMKKLALLDAARVYLGEIDNEERRSLSNLDNVGEEEGDFAFILNQEIFETLKFEDFLPYSAKKVLIQVAPVKSTLMIEGLWWSKFYSNLANGKGRKIIFWESGLEDRIHFARSVKERLDPFFAKRVNLFDDNCEKRPSSSGLELEKIQKIKNISPSKLKDYIDCPRKYYYHGIKNLNVYPQYKEDITPGEIGTLLHDVISGYLKDFFDYDRGKLEILVNEKTEYFVAKESKKRVLTKLIDLRHELLAKSENVIKYLNNLIKRGDGYQISIEKPFIRNVDGVDVRGRADLIIKNNKILYLFDFKRSTVPSKHDFENLDDLQLWFYLSNLIDMNKDADDLSAIFGFLNLGDLEKSRIFSLNSPVPNSHIGNTKIKIDSRDYKWLLEKMGKYYEKEQLIISKINDEQDFSINPRTSDSCQFCTANIFCPKMSNE